MKAVSAPRVTLELVEPDWWNQMTTVESALPFAKDSRDTEGVHVWQAGPASAMDGVGLARCSLALGARSLYGSHPRHGAGVRQSG